MSLGILKVAAVLEKAGHTIEFLDLSGIENYLDVVEVQARKTTARVVCLTATTPQLPAATAIVERIRFVRPDLRIILGGPHVTLVCAAVKLEKKAGRTGRAHAALTRLEALFDVLVAGDGELAVFDAIAPDAPKIVDGDDPRGGLFMTNAIYDESPMPARHLVDVESYKYTIDGHKSTSIIMQLGCPFSCGFCGGRNSNMLRRIRTRTTASALHEIETIYKQTGHTGFMCYDDSTEILTRARGFVRFSDLRHEDEVAVLDPDSGHLQFEVPKRIIHRHFDGDMVTVKGKWMDLSVTPEHRMWVKTKYGNYRHRTADSLFSIPASDNLRFYQRMSWAGADVKSFSIPAYEQVCLGRNRGSPKVLRGVRTFDAETWIKFMAWYLSEGSCYRPKVRNGRGYRICIKQSAQVHPENVKELGELIRALGYKTSYSSDQYHIDSKELYEYLKQFGTSRHKFVPPEFKLMSEDLISLFVETYAKGDGHTSPREQTVIISFSKRMRDDLQEMAFKSGRWAFVNDRYCRVLLSNQRDAGVPPERLDTESYSGNVHCVTVSTGIVLVRRNGKAVWCGNCYDDELNVSRTMVELMDGIADLQDRLGVEFRLRGFVKSELFTDEQATAMYRAGFRWILCGFEAAHPRILENINKKATLEDNSRVVEICRRHDLKVKALMSVGHPGETRESIFAVRDWLLDVKPDDFDCTVITTYPGTPYYDEAIPHAELPDVWTYTCKKSGDRLHAYDVDFTKVAEYYKGDPEGGYHSYVFTDHLSAEEIVRLRDEVESTVREKLGIPFNPGAAAVRYEHSMGQGALPGFVLRTSKA
jgi:radical SAM superfamily enzyme YgiQ (UPF0313 family)